MTSLYAPAPRSRPRRPPHSTGCTHFALRTMGTAALPLSRPLQCGARPTHLAAASARSQRRCRAHLAGLDARLACMTQIPQRFHTLDIPLATNSSHSRPLFPAAPHAHPLPTPPASLGVSGCATARASLPPVPRCSEPQSARALAEGTGASASTSRDDPTPPRSDIHVAGDAGVMNSKYSVRTSGGAGSRRSGAEWPLWMSSHVVTSPPLC
ncbi:hypothetical protein DFH06DRAFT_60967 [Mycena polygramma]|nr:hypothetical protein DFH06DRAFT_60967 [Mycena polygramma]